MNPRRLPRPALWVEPVPDRAARARTTLARRLGLAHARLTGGALRMPVLKALDRLLPADPLPPVQARLTPDSVITLTGAVARGALIAGGYEHREIEVLATATRPGGVFVDVGANVGVFSIMIGHYRPASRVWAVEPLPANADMLDGYLSSAGLDGVRLYRCAAGAEHDRVVIDHTVDTAYAGRQVAGWRPAAGSVLCDLRPLDELWHEAGRPRVDAMKIDVEGQELEVLAGAHDILTRDQPVLVIESPTAYDAQALREALAPYRYRPTARRGMLPYNSLFTVVG